MSKKLKRTVIFSVAWGNPYTTPPNGLAKEFLVFEQNSDETKNYHRPPDWWLKKAHKLLDEFREQGIYTYNTASTCIQEPGKKWTPEQKAKRRLSNLEKRITKQYSIPALKEQAISEAISKKPDYYKGL
ncbi:MAG: hypothetical protein AAGF26_01605 [Cyanobacteria bacterium P01_G01_bin.49]